MRIDLLVDRCLREGFFAERIARLCLQGEYWDGLMHSFMKGECEVPEIGRCGGRYVAGIYFYSYMLLASFTLLNLFVAVCVRCTRLHAYASNRLALSVQR
jgi:hypothetical protein